MAHLERNPPLHPGLRESLVDVWVEVSNAGGAVGFLPPVTPEQVWPVASRAFDRVAAGTDDLVVAHDAPGDGLPAGFGFLATNDWALASHWGTIKRLQTRPDRRGRGIGAALLGELEDVARARDLVRVVLTVRGGTGTEDFYLGRGFALEARLPGRLRMAEGDEREELVMSKMITGSAAPGPTLRIRRLDRGLPLPAYAHAGDAGLDLRAREDVTLEPGARAVVPTGVAIALPPGCVGLVHPRSGLAARAGLAIVNAPGTIDAGYRGEVKVILVNLDAARPVAITRGDRIAQLVVQRVETVVVAEVDELPGTVRGEGGFGSTGA